MPHQLDSRSVSFAAEFRAFLSTKRETAADVDATVATIIADVRARGDAALIELTQRYDAIDLAKTGIRVAPAEIAAAAAGCPRDELDALHFARDRIQSHHERQRPKDDLYTDAAGVTLGSRWTAIDAVGFNKQRRVSRMALQYLQWRKPRFIAARFDVIGITAGEIVHIQDAWRLGR